MKFSFLLAMASIKNSRIVVTCFVAFQNSTILMKAIATASSDNLSLQHLMVSFFSDLAM